MTLTAIVNRECLLILGIKNMNKYILFSKFTNTTVNYICTTPLILKVIRALLYNLAYITT